MKRIIAVILVLGLFTSAVYGASTLKNISVAPNYATIKVDGKVIGTENFVHNGTTYVPLRAISENLSCTVEWDQKTKTASISSGISIGGSADTGLSSEGVKDLNDILKSLHDYNLLAFVAQSILLHSDNMKDWYGEGGFTPKESEMAEDSFADLKSYLRGMDDTLQSETPHVLSLAQTLKDYALESETTYRKLMAKGSMSYVEYVNAIGREGAIQSQMYELLNLEIYAKNAQTLKKLIEITE